MKIEEAKEKLYQLAFEDLNTNPGRLRLQDVYAIIDKIDLPQPEITHPKIKKPTNIKLGGLYYMPVLVTEMSIFAGVPGTCDVELEVELPNGNKMTSILDYFLNQGLIDLE